MPHARKTERVVVVRTDLDGNVLRYDVVEQPVKSAGREKSASLPRTPSVKQSSKGNRKKAYDEVEDDDEDEETKRSYRDTSSRAKSKQRRVRYVRPKSSVKIFDEKVDWNANPKIDANNDEAIKKIQNAPKSKMFHQKLDWRVKPRTETHNEKIIENFHRFSSKRQIFNERPLWNAEPKIDSHNEKFVDSQRRTPTWQIYDEKVMWPADPKIDSHNEDLVEQIRSAPKPIIYDEKFNWQSGPRIDHYNEEYIKHKEREKTLQREKHLFHLSQEWKPKTDRARIDHQNPQFEEYKKRRKSAKLPPIEDRKLEWKKTPRINQRNDDYIERLRQKRSIPQVFKEKLRWITKTPKIKARNEEYVENLKEQTRPKIINKLPRWNSQPKIDAYNESYDPNSYEKPTIVNEKLRWHARPKIDTGLEPDLEEEQFDDDDDDLAA